MFLDYILNILKIFCFSSLETPSYMYIGLLCLPSISASLPFLFISLSFSWLSFCFSLVTLIRFSFDSILPWVPCNVDFSFHFCDGFIFSFSPESDQLLSFFLILFPFFSLPSPSPFLFLVFVHLQSLLWAYLVQLVVFYYRFSSPHHVCFLREQFSLAEVFYLCFPIL